MATLTINDSLKAPVASQTAPEATTFINSTGEVAKYYFKNNPWKLSNANDFQKVFRFCIICGGEKFSNEEWSKELDMWKKLPLICKKYSCWDALAFIPGFVHRKRYIIETASDKRRVNSKKNGEFFEDVDIVVSFTRFNKVYASEKEMPSEYLETFKKLESFPVETRISEIDSIYFDYKKKNGIKIGEYMTDTSDPFLKALALYRQKSIKILESIRFKSSKL